MSTLLIQIRRRFGISALALANCLKIRVDTLLKAEAGGYDLPEIHEELERRLKEAGLEL